MSRPIFLPARKRPWLPTIGSATLHGLLLVCAMVLSHRSQAESEERVARADREPPRIDMIYVPVPEVRIPRPPPPRPEPPPPPPPPVRNTEPEPEPNAPPEAVRAAGTEREAEVAEVAESPEPREDEITLESEARRIFGPQRSASRLGGPENVRPMEAWVADRRPCIPHESKPRSTSEPAQLGTVVGRIFRQDTGQPLAGAHLQMVGTPYSTFTDWRGEYRFSFDASLIDNCRTQYVRVSAPGYESRLLVLVVGPNRSEDVLLRRR